MMKMQSKIGQMIGILMMIMGVGLLVLLLVEHVR